MVRHEHGASLSLDFFIADSCQATCSSIIPCLLRNVEKSLSNPAHESVHSAPQFLLARRNFTIPSLFIGRLGDLRQIDHIHKTVREVGKNEINFRDSAYRGFGSAAQCRLLL